MSGLDSAAAWAASAALIGLSLVPLGSFWVFNLRGHSGHQAQPVKLARIFLQAALTVFSIGVALAVVSPSILAATQTSRARTTGPGAVEAAVYIAVTSTFFVTTGSILVTLAVYFTGLCVLYMVLRYQKWWKVLRLDAASGAAFLFVLGVVWFARALVGVRRSDGAWLWLSWLIVIVDVAVCLISAGVAGLAIYVAPKMKSRGLPAVGNMSALLLSASFLWLFRCIFVLAVDIKTIILDWSADEIGAQKIIYPILNFWVSATVLGLVAVIMRRPMWSDPAAIPDSPPEQPLQVLVVQAPGYYPHPQYGHQPHPQYQRSYYPEQQPVTHQERSL